jgi:hypothetical protein
LSEWEAQRWAYRIEQRCDGSSKRRKERKKGYSHKKEVKVEERYYMYIQVAVEERK